MQYTKAQVSFCDSLAFKRLSLAARGAWLQLCIHCAKEENGGIIAKAKQFDDMDWLMSCGMKKKDLQEALKVNLISWDGDNLIIHGYDSTGEDKLQVQRQQGGHGNKGAEHGKKGGRPAKEKPPSGNIENPPRGLSENPPIPLHTTPYQSTPLHASEQSTVTTWIRTKTSDRERTEENQNALAGLIKRFGITEVYKTAEKLVFSRGEKLWPDDKELLSKLVVNSTPAPVKIEELPDDLHDLPDGHPLKPPKRINTPLPFPVDGKKLG